MAVRKVFGASTREVQGHYLKTRLRMYILPVIAATALSVYFSLHWLQGFAYRVSVPLVLTVAVLSFFAAFLLLSLIVSGVVQAICSKRITEVLQRG